MEKRIMKKTLTYTHVKLFVLGIMGFLLLAQTADALENGLARTPPMGWSTWNIFASNIDETKIKAIADAMVSSGMRDAGYVYLNVDDTWMKAGRDSNGNLAADPVKFPGGMKALADYIHGKGLKLGLYGDRGTATCCNITESGSQGYETADAQTLASWGVDYWKYDSCNASLDLQTQYTTMRDALANSGRAICYSICCWYYAGSWMIDCGNLWRTTSDVTDSFSSFMGIVDTNQALYANAGPGHWNDPDMLEVGNGGCTFEEYKTHFSLWCIMAAPLIAGNDIRSMSSQTQSILCNTDAIAIDQDSAGIQGHIVVDNGDLEVWMKPLGSASGTEKAVLLLNRSGSSASITVNWSNIGLSGAATVRDLWSHSDLGSYSSSYSASVPSHGGIFLRISVGGVVTTAAPSPAPTQAAGIPGDVNSSGSIDIVDALLIAQFYVGLNPAGFVSANADVNKDGNIDIVDALRIAQCYVGLVSCNF
jgi:alpha-galactosidase